MSENHSAVVGLNLLRVGYQADADRLLLGQSCLSLNVALQLTSFPVLAVISSRAYQMMFQLWDGH